MIYADYAATSGSSLTAVTKAVTDVMANPGNAGRGSHEQTLSAGRILLEARMTIAEFFDVSNPLQVVFTSGVTESLNTVIKGILTPKDHVITTWAEHNSVLRPLYELQDQGMELSITDPDLEQIEKLFKDNTRMVVMTHGSNVTGDIYPITAIGRACRERGIIFAVDAAQTAGSKKISMIHDNIDILCFTGHKGLRGPQGTGGICIKEGVRIRPLKSGGTGMDSFSRKNPEHLPEMLEVGTVNLPGIAGLAAGVKYIQNTGILNILEREQMLAERFFRGVKDISGIYLYGDFSDFRKRTAIISLNIKDYSSAKVSDELEQHFEILTRSGAHCAPLVHEHFHTKEQGMVRFSFGYETDTKEIDECIEAVNMLAV